MRLTVSDIILFCFMLLLVFWIRFVQTETVELRKKNTELKRRLDSVAFVTTRAERIISKGETKAADFEGWRKLIFNRIKALEVRASNAEEKLWPPVAGTINGGD